MDLVGMIPAANVVKVALRWTVEGLEAFNIINVLCPAPASGSDLTAIAAVFQAWWTNDWRACISNQASWQGADLTALDSAGAPFLAYLNSGTLAGVDAQAPYPPQVSLAVSLRTGLSGRSYRGRFYVAGLTKGFPSVGGLLSAGSVTSIQTLANGLRTRMVTAGYAVCVLSLYSGVDVNGDKIPRSSGVATPISIMVVGNRLDSQRRRLPVEGRV